MTFFIIILVIICLVLAFISLKLFRLVWAGIFALTHYFYMITDEYFEGVSDQGPFYVILKTDYWWLGGLYFIFFLSKYYNVLLFEKEHFGWKSISFYTVGHIIITIIASSICSSSGVNNVIENGLLATTFSFISMLLTRGITIGSLLDDATNHVQGVLVKANDKRYEKSLEDLANSGPEGKKAAEHLIKTTKMFDNIDMEELDKEAASWVKIGKEDNQKKKS
jgi:hypothetical protein